MDQAIDRPPRHPGRFCQFCSGAAYRPVEPARYGQQGIAQSFEIEPFAVHSPQPLILGIGLSPLGAFDACLLIGG